MADYLVVPYAPNVLNDGVVLYSLFNVGDFKIGNTVQNNPTIKVGLYKAGVLTYGIVFGSSELVTNCNVQEVSPAGTVDFECNEILLAYEHGYYSVVEYPTRQLQNQFVIPEFDTLQQVLDAFQEPEPEPATPGIVVVAIAGENNPSGSVVVTAIASMSGKVDPLYQGGTTVPGGGTGTFSDESDPTPLGPMPTISAAQTGLVTLFRPTYVQLRELGSYLWTNLTDFIDNLNKLFVNPMDYMIALNIVPVVPDVGNTRAIKIGNVVTEIEMPIVPTQWYEFDCGSITIEEYWGSFLDYAPNTRISLFLPFIGDVPLNTDEVMGETLSLKYRIDLLSGQCTAILAINGNVRYEYNGSCSVPVPLTGSDWSRVYRAGINAISAVAGSISFGATGTAPPAAEEKWGGEIFGAPPSASAASDATGRSSGLDVSRLTNGLGDAARSLLNSKVLFPRAGSIGGVGGFLGYKTAFVDISYPKQALPEDFKKYYGYPSHMEKRLGAVTGYTEVERVLIDIPGTDEELAEVISALKGGVYLGHYN